MNQHKLQKQIIEEALPKPVGVTTILKQSKSKSALLALKKWEKTEIKVRGVEGFKKYQQSMLSTGTNVHTEIENALLENRGINKEHSKFAESIARSGHFDLIDRNAELFVEQKHVHPYFGYNGVVDLECIFNGKRTVIDWKTSQTKKTADQLFDDPLQIAAYAYMVESCHPTRRIEQGAIVKMYKDGSPADMFVLTRKKLERTFSTFCERYLTFIALKMLNDENDRVVREYYGDEEGFEWLTMKKDEKIEK
jgi:ATP-dependent exoDNAse (exonuclease V) beta subunit